MNHDLYYGGDERPVQGTTRKRMSTPDGKVSWYVLSQPQGHYPAGEVHPDVHYQLAAENGGLKNQPFWRSFAPASWFDDAEQGIYEPYDTGLAEYLRANPLEVGDVVRMAFVPRGFMAKWAGLRVIKPAEDFVADLFWIKSDGTEQELKANFDFGVADAKTGRIAITDGDAGDKSDNFLELRVKAAPKNMKDWFFTMDYDVEGFDYLGN